MSFVVDGNNIYEVEKLERWAPEGFEVAGLVLRSFEWSSRTGVIEVPGENVHRRFSGGYGAWMTLELAVIDMCRRLREERRLALEKMGDWDEFLSEEEEK